MKKLFTLLLAVVAGVTFTNAEIFNGTCGAEGDGSNLQWSLDTEQHTLVITGSGKMADYDAWNSPSPWSEKSWSITSLSLPEGLTTIGNGAFIWCNNLTSVVIPNSVTQIGEAAFRDCRALKSVKMCENVKEIGESAFNNCQKLASITLPEGLTIINNSVFMCCFELSTITIPNSVKKINAYAFSECNKMSSVILSNAVDTIGEAAFEYCLSLSSITIPESVTYIGEKAFYDCSSLRSIKIPDSISFVGRNAFSYVLNVEYNGSLYGAPWDARCLNAYIDGDFAYSDDTKSNLLSCYINVSGDLIIPETVTEMQRDAFSYCKMRSVTIPNSLNYISDYAFSQCKNLEEIHFGKNITSIGKWAFYWCSALTTLDLPESIVTLGNSCFLGCTALTFVYVPASVTSMESSFVACNALTEIKVDPMNTVYSDIDGVMFNKNQNKLLMYPAGKQQTEYVVPAGVDTIAREAFYSCQNLTSVSLPSSLKYIDNYAFAYSRAINSFRCEAVEPPAVYNKGSYTFFLINKAESILYVPEESIDAYKVAVEWKDFGQILPLSAQSLDEIKDGDIYKSKFLLNGQLFIRRGDKAYTITGQEVR
jgi:hypothetical protein